MTLYPPPVVKGSASDPPSSGLHFGRHAGRATLGCCPAPGPLRSVDTLGAVHR